MNITILDEPMLEFAHGGRHIDPRHGIDFYGPADLEETSVRVIRVGIVGPQASIDGVKRWLDSCRSTIEPRDSHLGHLYMPFPGFDTDRAFRSTIIWNGRLERPIPKRDLDALEGANPLTAAQSAVDMYDRELEALNEEPNCDVVIVCRPDNLIDTGSRPRRGATTDDQKPLPPGSGDFHSLLKARSLRYSQPIQIIRRSTWDPTFKDPKDAEVRVKQDEATRAWNLHTALYYKAGGVPWRLPRDAKDLASCYVGVAFYRSPDQETLETSVAQVFNQRGDGVIVRGGQARLSKDDRQPHLTEEDAHQLLHDALDKYRREHRQSPARIVLHKTSSFTPQEAAGFRAAANEQYIDILELIWLTRSEHVRLFRRGQQAPLRGTLMSLADDRHVLYTRGSVPFYKTYPGMYVPQPVGLRLHDTESSPEDLANELLALTKMNWNATQLDGRDPITLRTADKVGDILRHLGPSDLPASRYAFYM
ncbi:argonaute/piwi family protein [Nocardioides aquiterrae]|uniref:Protein argonaute n=1 Tax=Nocardioides aquiterrae TaxID=203799 RepID=A0ABN1UID9_9ACTN